MSSHIDQCFPFALKLSCEFLDGICVFRLYEHQTYRQIGGVECHMYKPSFLSLRLDGYSRAPKISLNSSYIHAIYTYVPRFLS